MVIFVCFVLYFKGFSQQVKMLDRHQLDSMLSKSNDTAYVYNFFASWCAPCIKEIPALIQFAEYNKSKKVKLCLISLDFKKDIDRALLPIIDSFKINEYVYWMNESNPNSWINSVDKKWSGSIPATLIVHHQKKKLITEPMSFERLNKIVCPIK